MPITDVERVNRLNDIATKRTLPDIFQIGNNRFNVLRAVNERVSVQRGGHQPTNGDMSEAQRAELEIARSKSNSLLQMHNTMYDDGWADGGSPTSYAESCNYLDPMAFLLLTANGNQLRDLLFDNPVMANDVLRRIDQAAMSLAGTNEFNRHLMIQAPIRAVLDKRKGIIERVEKVGDFTNLIQKQERLLLRIGTTTDMCLGSNGVLGNQVFPVEPSVEMFKSLWANHVSALSKGSNTSKYQFPAMLTFLLYETLFMTCNPKTLATKIHGGTVIRRNLYDLYPLKEVLASLKGNARKGTTSRFFT